MLATPVAGWDGWPLFVRGWRSLVGRHLNMFSLIALGVGVAWSYSATGLLLPDLFPPGIRMADGLSVMSTLSAAFVVMVFGIPLAVDRWGRSSVAGL